MAKLFVICGHGAGDSGAVGNGYTEAERVRALGKRIKELGGSSVTLGDVNRNYYADNGISSLNISKDTQIIELHMDSAAASARGGHVIIKSGFTADKYDNALANMLKEILPGRSSMIVPRSDLANPKRAAAKGYGYRLVEFGFISNATDVNIFNTRMDDIARGVLKAFDIVVSSGSSSTPSQPNKPSTPSASGTKYKVGHHVTFSTCYKSSTDPVSKHISASEMTRNHGVITKIVAGAHNPYLLDNGLCWVNDGDIRGFYTESSSKKSVEELAKEVIAGKWGNGSDRKKRLEAAGYDYDAVQNRVNQLL